MSVRAPLLETRILFRKPKLPGLGIGHPLDRPVLEDLLVRLGKVAVADGFPARRGCLRMLLHLCRSPG
jgi:hypothetical protein